MKKSEKKNCFTKKEIIKKIRLTLDEKEDLILFQKLVKKLKTDFSLSDIISYYNKNKSFFDINQKFSTGISSLKLNLGQLKWIEAKKFIAGGNMLFQKDQIVFYLKDGQDILKKLRDVMSTIWIIINILT